MENTLQIQSIMDKRNKNKKGTGTGGIGTPRPDEERMVKRVPSPSISGNRGEGQTNSQICLEENAIGWRERDEYMFTSASEENSDSSQ